MNVNVLPLPRVLSTLIAAAHAVRERLADREAQTGAAEAPRDRGVDLRKRFEQVGLLGVGHPDAGVAHAR